MSEQLNETSKMTALLNTLSKQHSDELSKYTYFILAVAGAAIAYALKNIEDKQPSYSLIFLLLSIVFWSISFGFGIRNLHSFRQHMSENANCIINSLTAAQMQEKLNPWESRAYFASRCQFAFLVGGSLSYMTFHVSELLQKLNLCNA